MQVGRASVEIEGDVSGLARDTERKIDAALTSMRIDPIEIETHVDTDGAHAQGVRAGREVAEGFTDGTDGRLRDDKGRFAASFGKAGDDAVKSFGASLTKGVGTLGPSLFSNPAVLAIGGTLGALIGSAAITAFSGVVLGAGLLGIGIAALLGGHDDRAKALADLDKAKEAVKEAEIAAKSGSAASLRRVAEARKVLAEAEKVANNGKAYRDLDKALDSLKSTFSEVAQQAARPLLKPLTTALGELDQLVRELRPEFTQIFSTLAPIIPLLTDGISKFSGEVVRGLRDSMPGITTAFVTFASVLPEIGRSLGDFFRTIFGNKDVIDNVTRSVLHFITGALDVLGPVISTLTVLYSGFMNVLTLSREGYALALDALLNWAEGGTGAFDRVKEAFAPLKAALQDVWDKFKEFAGADDPEEMGVRFTTLVQSIKDAWGPLKEFLGVVWDEAWVIIKNIWDTKVVPWWENDAKPWLKEALSTAMSEAWELAKTKASEKIEELKGEVLRKLGELVFGAAATLTGLPLVVITTMAATALGAIKGASAVVSGAVSTLGKLPGEAAKAISGIKSKITGAFSGAAGWLYGSGRSIIQGLIDGMDGMGSAVAAAASRAAQEAKDHFPHSPTKKGPLAGSGSLFYSGQTLVDDLVRGLDFNRTELDRVLGGIAGGIAGISLNGPVRGGDGAAAPSLSIGEIHVHVSGATGAEAGQEAAEVLLERLAGAVLVR